ncbi:type II toxin-antitoxin system prevent-host-death family antitoxin [Thermosulfuriphilus ammonigenes]|uniref:Antitoxin n=1 Tax=Thermosulfuriphilus ammonigenes TaxID=1936021 RepID=A0A6G7PYG0_9BACT|nr:type II toxin-antitoxin system prevent-host-death family antitoxin [Thermosulfuriphilus ammonigenes]MBA2849042.1 prevent-host-death family protein [Thermosulfuriphilus ammonigenes]QIJ72729.1 type II toxin-antitoxin system prevent-host-death family antitoxin [Thermosulfuriphilus ammonigenes]
MAIIGVYEARTKFSELLDRVARGERFVITRRGVPVAVIEPVAPQRRRKVEEVIEEIKKFRKKHRHRLNGLDIKELIEEGRM